MLPGFDGERLELYDRVYQLERDGDVYRVATSNGAETESRRVVMTTGSHHFQTYWLETGQGRRIELLPLVYQIAEARWIPFDALLLAPPNLRQVSGAGGEWNTQCLICHSVGGKPRPRADGAMDTTAAEFGIACEACHGPGQEHVELNRSPVRRYRLWLTGATDESIVNPARLSALRSAQVCGQCHAVQDHADRATLERWVEHGFEYRAGDDLLDTRIILRQDTPRTGVTKFWADGQNRTHGREYLGVTTAPCFAGAEYSCGTCHQLHQPAEDPRPLLAWADDQLVSGGRGNAVCVGCHERFADESALAGHSHHEPGSPGRNCYNCHMPNTVFGAQKATRSHHLTSPSVQESLATGRPNACSQCHLDRSLAWTAGWLESWYGTPVPELSEVEQTTAAVALWTLSGEANQRALMGWSMGWAPAQQASGTDWMPPYLAQLMMDPYTANRSVAYRSLRSLPGFEDVEFDYVQPAAGGAEAANAVRQRWSRGLPLSAGRDAVLLDAAGNLSPLWDILLAQRNERLIYLSE